jgi:glycosyltransferase involved in cell wall biosynthesis
MPLNAPWSGKVGRKLNSNTQLVFTLCTPSYNRAPLLRRVHDSLVKQTFGDFEWLVVDDGSTDNTREVVEKLAAYGKIPVRYFWKPNGGKHTALNLGVREAKGALFTVIDSDDWFEPRALERMKFHWNQIPSTQQSRMKGVCGLFAYESGKIVGDRFPADVLEADDLDLLLRYQVDGDKIGFTRTDVMREFPFPENLQNSGASPVKFVTESLVWNRMGRKYPTRFVNEVFAIKEYQAGGLTDRGRLIHVQNSGSTLLYISEILNCGRKLPFKLALKNYSNFIRYSLHERLGLFSQIKEIPGKQWFLPCVPIGMMLWLKDRRLVATATRGAK